MPETDYVWNSNFRGIIIRTDPAKNPTFMLTVKEQLDLIYSKPVGKKLLDGINAGTALFTPTPRPGSTEGPGVPYKVKIVRADSTGTIATPVGVPAPDGAHLKWNAGNVAIRLNEENAKNGKGTATAIKYHPNVFTTPDGARPPFIGLAHELVHALHNILGTALAKTPEEEEWTVGLGTFAGTEICENAIREEHRVGKRVAYTGL